MRAVQREGDVHIEFLLEERSAEAALEAVLPTVFSDDVGFNFHVFQGKHDLLKNLPIRLKGYRHWIPDDWRIIVLIDEDREDCLQLKAKLEQAASEAGFMTKTRTTSDRNFRVVNRLAIEELDAWFFGDPEAVRKAYPNVSRTFHNRANFRNPDAIAGGTHEALGRVLKRYYPKWLPKTVVAQNIASHMIPDQNTSKSFQVFLEGLKACVGESGFKI